ncbi:hypothetical protein SAMN06265377_2669 [Flagellimonas pacifica]|uniref:Uncharacterized protein n=1 Tax=Flagellimonas pacifica TaxID=1247520 RepID=A0A285MUJ1_9FLAO|nr:hypothetical protein SAMN06265377_2669 [Allomuricauda parva]
MLGPNITKIFGTKLDINTTVILNKQHEKSALINNNIISCIHY